MNDDRRNASRARVSIPVTFRLADGTEHQGAIENISRNGLLLITKDPVKQAMQVEITVSDSRGRGPLSVVGKVVRFAPAGAVGVAFVSVDDDALSFVRDLEQS